MCVKESDVREVLLYRPGLVTVATSFMTAASAVFMLEDNAVRQVADLRRRRREARPVGALSLLFIHIYVTQIKRFLQAHWAAGHWTRAWCSPCWSTLPHTGLSVPRFAALTAEGICKCSVCFLYQNMSGVNAVTVPCSW